MKKWCVFLIIMLVLATLLYPCTSAVITGKASLSGRPMLWKNRDTGNLENKMIHLKSEKFAFTGVFNVSDSLNRELWMGTNETGFSIMNTASYNVNAGVEWKKAKDQEGLFMKKALEQCATVEEFESFLQAQSGKWGVEANFGVIDAKGGAAFFETGFYDYVKYDVNDPVIAPNGYLIRTNFSFAGEPEDGQGYIRYTETMDLFQREMLKGGLSVEFLLKKAARNMHHGLMKRDIWENYLPRDRYDEYMVSLQDYVVRYWSASSLIVEGVMPGENPGATTLWTLIGFPLSCMVTPVWIGAGDLLPSVIVSENYQNTPLTDWSLLLKERCFPYTKGNGKSYINTAPLKNKQNDGFLQSLIPLEDPIIEKAHHLQEQFYINGVNIKEIKRYNKWLDSYIQSAYEQYFEHIGAGNP
jgi:hypothetical protein